MPREVDRPKIALIGRPNVGKSTLYNRLTGRRQAITDEMPGVTRDRLYGLCEWQGYELTIIDCGGIGSESEDPLWEPVAENSRIAMEEADVIILMVDARGGLTLGDDEVLRMLRKLKTPVVVAVNKVESTKQLPDTAEFYKLGYGELYLTSALTGANVGEMLDDVIAKLDWTKWPKATPEFIAWRYGEGAGRGKTRYMDAGLATQGSIDEGTAPVDGTTVSPEGDDPAADDEDYPFAWAGDDRPRFIPDESWREEPVRLVFAGRQNAGKSSLTNALLGENRALVAELPGTTRDPLIAQFTRDGQRFEVLDTAGIKRISRLKEDVDYYSLIRAEKGLRFSEIALLTIDATQGVTEQDRRVAQLIADSQRAIVIVINKTDILLADEDGKSPWHEPKQDSVQLQLYEKYVRNELARLKWAEVIFTSATKDWGLDQVCQAALRSRENFHRRLDNNAVRTVLEEAIALSPPPIVKNRELKFYDFRQIGNCPPTFLIEINDKMAMRQAYRRFLENNLRKHFEFDGTHIHIVWYTRKRKPRRKRRA